MIFTLFDLLSLCAATKCYGRSQEQFPPGNMFAAVSEGLWDNGAACGRKYRLTCLSGANKPCKDQIIDVQVVDACSKNPCPSNLVLSRDAFTAISRIPNAKINVEFIQYISLLLEILVCVLSLSLSLPVIHDPLLKTYSTGCPIGSGRRACLPS